MGNQMLQPNHSKECRKQVGSSSYKGSGKEREEKGRFAVNKERGEAIMEGKWQGGGRQGRR